jgi:hypothetical protein
MTIHYDIETDGLFLKGIEESIEKGLEKGIKQGIELEKQVFVYKLWSLQEFSLEKIAPSVCCSVRLISAGTLSYSMQPNYSIQVKKSSLSLGIKTFFSKNDLIHLPQ